MLEVDRYHERSMVFQAWFGVVEATQKVIIVSYCSKDAHGTIWKAIERPDGVRI